MYFFNRMEWKFIFCMNVFQNISNTFKEKSYFSLLGERSESKSRKKGNNIY